MSNSWKILCQDDIFGIMWSYHFKKYMEKVVSDWKNHLDMCRAVGYHYVRVYSWNTLQSKIRDNFRMKLM